MKQNILPSIALIVLIVGLPQLSETVYTPSLPDITRDLPTCIAMTEYTLTIYLFGFALGILFWGKLSDKTGRKPCILAGLFIFMQHHCSMFRVGKPFPIFSAICTFFVGTGGQIFARNPLSKPATIYCIRHDYPSLTQR